VEPPADLVTVSRSSAGHVLDARMWLERPRAEVFPFFADAFNLEAITPTWLRFSVGTPAPIAMREGTLIDYRLRLHGVPLAWRSVIAAWEPPARFVDRQVAGPYAVWVHEHRFAEVAGGVLVSDRVAYRIRGGAAAHRILNAAVAGRDLRRIFEHRQRALRTLFGA
jgi:ligand-binding SRPBCC domain-containing protein